MGTCCTPRRCDPKPAESLRFWHRLAAVGNRSARGKADWRCLAQLSETLGLADDANAYYEDAHASARKLGARPMVARIGVEWGRLMARRGERAASRELASEGQSIAAELGMPRVCAQADALLARL